MAGLWNLWTIRLDASSRPEKGVCHLQGIARTSVIVDAMPFGQIWFRPVVRVRRTGVLTDLATRKHLPSSPASAYLQTWQLKLNHAKMVTAAFHLHNREAKHELKVKKNGKILPFCPVPTQLGVKLDRVLTYCHHLEALHKKNIRARFAAEAICGFRMGRWCQGVALSCLVPDPLDCCVLCTSLVSQPAYSPQ